MGILRISTEKKTRYWRKYCFVEDEMPLKMTLELVLALGILDLIGAGVFWGLLVKLPDTEANPFFKKVEAVLLTALPVCFLSFGLVQLRFVQGFLEKQALWWNGSLNFSGNQFESWYMATAFVHLPFSFLAVVLLMNLLMKRLLMESLAPAIVFSVALLVFHSIAPILFGIAFMLLCLLTGNFKT